MCPSGTGAFSPLWTSQTQRYKDIKITLSILEKKSSAFGCMDLAVMNSRNASMAIFIKNVTISAGLQNLYNTV